MDLLHATGIEKAWGDRMILRGADLTAAPGDHIGLVGANGCGKSTFMRILAGLDKPDHGTVALRTVPGVLDQDPRLPGRTVGESADAALQWHRDIFVAFEQATAAGETKAAGLLQDQLDLHGWDVTHRVDAMLHQLGAPPRDAEVSRLSGGERRRVALARALLGSPDLLMLDEPTNHLDAEVTEWLQEHLAGFRGALVIVTHDRYLLEAVATRIVEVEEGVCVGYEGAYTDYLLERAERQARSMKERDSRLNLLAREAAWAAKSPAARSTKQKARLQRFDALKESIPTINDQEMKLDLKTGDKIGRTFLEVRGLKKSHGGRKLMEGVDFDLGPGQRLGILGANGAGKSTLLRMIIGTDTPDAGTISRGPRVKLAVLDQERSGLDNNSTVFEAAGDGNTVVTIGEDTIHVAGFLNRFLFSRDLFDQKVAGLSGGERARLLLAKMLLQGANLLLLDEPTNDLDLMTLRVLEEALLAYDGAALYVTHDRAFLDRTCTGVLAFERNAKVVRYASRLQYVDAMKRLADSEKAEQAKKDAALAAKAPAAPVAEKKAKKGLSYREQKELDELPANIEKWEAEQVAFEAKLADPATYKGGVDVLALQKSLDTLSAKVTTAYARWEELEARK